MIVYLTVAIYSLLPMPFEISVKGTPFEACVSAIQTPYVHAYKAFMRKSDGRIIWTKPLDCSFITVLGERP
jgi:hypothetical protein